MLKKLDWTNFDWEYFQTLSIEIAKEVIPDCDFSDYLKPGLKQDGIDLISFNKTDGKFLCIQCKRNAKITTGDLDKIIEEFHSGKHFANSSRFILATSAELQNETIKTSIVNYQLKLHNDSNLQFDCWDKSAIENILRNRWDLVSKFFSEELADDFCYPKLKYTSLENIKPLKDYIPRKIIPFGKVTPEGGLIWSYAKRQTYNIKDILIENRLAATRICLVADAYNGKSHYLKNLAFELTQTGLQIQPVLIDIKAFNVQPIESILKTEYGAWKTIPLKDLVIIIDGIDEVPTEKFADTIRNINEFCKSHVPVSVIFSCRKLFYNRYQVHLILTGFEIFELYPLETQDVEWYLKIKLGNDFSNFKNTATQTGILQFLYHPFYLIHIVEKYLNSYELPDNKIKVIEELIASSNKSTLTRQLRGAESVKHESLLFKKTIEKFAFALQLAGTNSFNSEEMQELFNTEQHLLLQHNSLIVHSAESWSFANALFQEHIAASLLLNMSFDKIVSVCTIGNSLKKIKTKWIQTISSLLSILSSEDELFLKIIELIESDNIELIFQTESSNYDDTLKLALLKLMIEKCITKDIRPLLVYEDTISLFIQSSSSCSDYLLDCLINREITIRVRIVCCRVLKNTTLTNSQKQTYLEFVIKSIYIITDSYYAGQLIQVLSIHIIGTKELIEQFLKIEHLKETHEFRNALYELIMSLGLVDDFYYFGITGLSALLKHNKDILHSGSEYSLETFLLSTNNKYLLCFLLKQFKEHGWIDYVEKQGDYRNFLQLLLDKIANTLNDFPLMIFPIAKFIKELGKKYLRQEFKQLDNFLEKTNSYNLVVRILINDIFNDTDWELGALITHDSYDYILFEFEEMEYNIKKLRNCFTGLRYTHKNEIANNFYKLCYDATEGTITDKGEAERYQLNEEIEKTKRSNDLIFIQSKDAFTKGLKNYFKAYGKKSIPEEDIYYIDVEGNRGLIRLNADSHFIYEYLANWHRGAKTIRLNDCLENLNKENHFLIFRAEAILSYPFSSEESDKILIPIIREYYLTNLPTANFENSLWIENDLYHCKNKEVRLGKIFKKYRFSTDEKYLLEFIWLDDGGTKSFQSAALNKGTTISAIVLETLDDSGKEKLKKKIIENLQTGIKFELVLGNHIGLCKHLKIVDAAELILQSIKSISTNYSTKVDGIDIYLELNGNPKEILDIYSSMTDYNDYVFTFLTSRLSKYYPPIVSFIGIGCINSTTAELENKIKVAQIVAEIGGLEGFSFLVNELRINKIAPHYIQAGRPVTNVDTANAISELEDISYLIIDKRFNDETSFHDAPRNIILEWLYALANKSQSDLELVIDFFEKSMNKLSDHYEDAKDFNWYINRALENFRNSDNAVKSIIEVKKILSEVIV